MTEIRDGNNDNTIQMPTLTGVSQAVQESVKASYNTTLPGFMEKLEGQKDALQKDDQQINVLRLLELKFESGVAPGIRDDILQECRIGIYATTIASLTTVLMAYFQSKPA